MVTGLVDKATNELLIQTDWTTVLQISDILNRDPIHARGVVRQITKKLKERSRVILLALELSDSLLQNCECTHVYFGERTFQTELCRLIMNKKTKLNVKEKTLEIVESWGNAFQARHDVPGFYETYSFIKRSGYKFPPRPNDAPVLNFNNQPQKRTVSSANMLPTHNSSTNVHSGGGGGIHNTPTQNTVSSGGGSVQPIKNQEISSIKGSTSVFSEMISFLNVEEEDPLENDLIKELFEQCKQSQIRVKEMVESGTASEKDLNVLLKLNDEINSALNDHEACIKRRRAFVAGGYKPLSQQQNVASGVGSSNQNYNIQPPTSSGNNRQSTYLTKHKELEEIDFFKAPDGVSPYSVQQQLQPYQQLQQQQLQQQQQQPINNGVNSGYNPFAQPSPQQQQLQQIQQQQQQLQRIQAGSKADDFDMFVANRQQQQLQQQQNINSNPFANNNGNNSNNILPYMPSTAKSLPQQHPFMNNNSVLPTAPPPPFKPNTAQSNPFNSPPIGNTTINMQPLQQPFNTPMYNNNNSNLNNRVINNTSPINNGNGSLITSNYPNYNAIRTDNNIDMFGRNQNQNPYGLNQMQQQQQQPMMMNNNNNSNFSPPYSQFTNYAQNNNNASPYNNNNGYNSGMPQSNMYPTSNNMNGKSSLM